MNLRQLFVALGFKIDQDSLKEIDEKINSIKNLAVNALGAIGFDIDLAQAESLKEEFSEINEQAQNTAKELKDQKEAQEEIEEATKKTEKAARKTEKSAGKTKRSYEEAAKSVDTLAEKLKTVLTAVGIGFSLTQMNALSEEFNGINDQIKNATKGLGNQKEIQEKIMQSANDTKMSYADTAKVVGALVQENKELFSSVDEAIAFNDAVTKTFKVAGKSNEEIAGLTEAINKSFAKGKVDSETISQLLEQAPEAVEYLNRQLGSTTDQLEQMVSDGRVSLADLKDAFMMNVDEINEGFNGLDYSISDALLNIRNLWGYWLDDINASTGLTKTLAKYMTRAFDMIMKGMNKVRDISVKVTKKFGGIENVLKFIGIAAGVAFAAFKGKKILEFLKSFTGFLNVANLKMLAIIAVFVAIVLIVEDFVNFMQGNGSVIGEVLEKMGFDVDEVRERIISAWNKVKGFLIHIWSAISDAAKFVTDKLGELWEKYGDKIVAVFSAIIGILKTNIDAFVKLVRGTIDLISGILTGDGEKALNGFREIIEGVLNWIFAFWKGIWEAVYALFGETIDKILDKVKQFVDKVKEKLQGVREFFGGIADFFSGDTTVKNTTVANASGTGNRTNNVNQNVNIENTFNGTDPQTMSKAATKSAEDTTDQLAKGLKYGT